MNDRIRKAVVAASTAALLGVACESPAPAAPGTDGTTAPSSSPSPVGTASASPAASIERKVAFVYDGLEGEDPFATGPYQGAELAFEAAAADGTLVSPVELVPVALDHGEAAAAGASMRIADDPAIVAALIAPGVVGQRAIAQAVDVPVMSLSSRDHIEAPPGTWLRMVPSVEALGHEAGTWAADLATGDATLCLSPAEGDGSRFGRAAASAADGSFGEVRAVPAGAIVDAGCDVVVWTGGVDDAAEVVADLGRPSPPLIGGPPLRDPSFIDAAGPAANGTMAVCGCADVTTALSLDAQSFVQNYQSEYGLPPGPGVVEAWDAAHLLADGIEATGSASALGPWLASQGPYEGLGGVYAFDAEGELADPAAHTYRSAVAGGRWTTLRQPR